MTNKSFETMPLDIYKWLVEIQPKPNWPDGVWFKHIDIGDAGGKATFVFEKFEKRNDGIYFGVSFCSPSDRFVKSKGREIAYERLKTLKKSLNDVHIKYRFAGVISVPPRKNSKEENAEIIFKSLSFLWLDFDILPEWVENNINQELMYWSHKIHDANFPDEVLS